MWKLVKDVLISFVTTISAIIPILAFIGIDNYDELVSQFKGSNYLALIVIISIISFLGLSIGGYIINSKYVSNKSKKLHEFFHNLRNDYLKSSYDSNDIQNSVNNISSFIEKLSVHKFNVCIKTFNFNEEKTYTDHREIEELEMKTLARAGEDNVERNKTNSQIHKVKENTDYRSILFDEKCNIYACSNLRMLSIESKLLSPVQEYENSDKHYLKKYVTTLVIPIRIYKDYFSNFNSTNKGVLYNNYLTIGFLCVDCKKPISGALCKELTGFLMAISDALFVPLFTFLNPNYKSKMI